MTSVFYCKYSIQLSEDKFRNYLKRLPRSIQKDVLKYRKWEDRQNKLYGKLLLIMAIEQCNVQISLDNLKYTRYKKPYFEVTDFNFSTTHTEKMVVLAVSSICRIGIDIESKKRNLTTSNFKSCFSAKEWDSITGSTDIKSKILELWTKKEACLKADGRGINFPLRNIHIKDNLGYLEHSIYSLMPLNIDSDYHVFLAHSEKIEIVEFISTKFE